ncbi:MAG: DUF1634 domain-containing protein [Vicinamibacteraceae bacterium]|nr:DUF1634 domain-containing protein [Vicinamibacteraceae bacterium]
MSESPHDPTSGAPEPGDAQDAAIATLVRDDRRFELLLGRTLGIGIAIATVLLAAGLLWWILAPQVYAADRLLRAGLIALMCVPVGRLIVSLVEFAAERDWVFFAIVSGVLSVLGGTLWVALS